MNQLSGKGSKCYTMGRFLAEKRGPLILATETEPAPSWRSVAGSAFDPDAAQASGDASNSSTSG